VVSLCVITNSPGNFPIRTYPRQGRQAIIHRLAALLSFEDAQALLVRRLHHVSCSGVGRLAVVHRMGREKADLVRLERRAPQ
jgi:hypothetical protein